MLPALYDDDRRTLLRVATMLVLGSLCVLPLTAQNSEIAGAAGVDTSASDPTLTTPARLTFPAYELSRDPFVPVQSFDVKAGNVAAVTRAGQVTDIGVVLPPNAGALSSNAPVMDAGIIVGPIVRAIVLGNPARALVEVGGAVHVLGVGDRIGDLTVREIAAGRVTLSDGSALLPPRTQK